MRDALALLRHREFRLHFGGHAKLWGCAAIATSAILAQLASREVRELPPPGPRLANAPEGA